MDPQSHKIVLYIGKQQHIQTQRWHNINSGMNKSAQHAEVTAAALAIATLKEKNRTLYIYLLILGVQPMVQRFGQENGNKIIGKQQAKISGPKKHGQKWQKQQKR